MATNLTICFEPSLQSGLLDFSALGILTWKLSLCLALTDWSPVWPVFCSLDSCPTMCFFSNHSDGNCDQQWVVAHPSISAPGALTVLALSRGGECWNIMVWSFSFLIFFFNADHFFKIFIEFVTVLLLSYALFFGQEACSILTPQPGTEPAPPALEGEFLTTAPPGSPMFGLRLSKLFFVPNFSWKLKHNTLVISYNI